MKFIERQDTYSEGGINTCIATFTEQEKETLYEAAVTLGIIINDPKACKFCNELVVDADEIRSQLLDFIKSYEGVYQDAYDGE